MPRSLPRLSILAALLCLAGAPPVLAAMAQFPPISAPATQESHPGKIVFTELVTPDLRAAKKFYGSLFGWTFRDMRAGDLEYAEAFLHGVPVAGLIHKAVPASERRQPAWLGFISAPDVDAAAKAARHGGAHVLFGPRDIGGRGREAVLADPQGAVFAIVSSTSGDPPDVRAMPGEWIWSSLITKDPDAAAGFYQTLFDYEVFDLPARKGTRPLMLASENYARASVNPLPSDDPRAHPYWLNYVRVRDARKMAARAAALGGSVIVKPHMDRHGGRVAVVADPQGAPFGIIEWPDSQSKKVGQ